MNLNHLAVFHAVAEEGSISRGAARLFISQPAVSKQVAELERSLGIALLDRLPRGVRLTEAGELLAGHARRLFAVEAEAERAMAEWKGLKRGRLRVGASLTIGEYLLPTVLAAFHTRHPQVTLELDIANTEAVTRSLLDYRADVALIEGLLTDTPEVAATVFSLDELIAVAAPDHPLAVAGEPVSAARLCQEPFVQREAGSGTRAVIDRALTRRELHIEHAVLSVDSTEALKRAVAARMGVAILSRLAVEAELTAGTLAHIPLADLTFTRPLHLLQVRGRVESRAVRAFLEMLPPAPASLASGRWQGEGI